MMRVSSSSSPRMANCKWRGVMRLTCRQHTGCHHRPMTSQRCNASQCNACARGHINQGPYLEILGSVACQLEHLGSKILCIAGGVQSQACPKRQQPACIASICEKFAFAVHWHLRGALARTKDRCGVHSCCGANPPVRRHTALHGGRPVSNG